MLLKSNQPETSSNAPLRASERKQRQRYKLRRQSWLRTSTLLIIIVLAWGVDSLFIKSNLVVTKSMALGAGLSWLAQNIFTWFVFRFINAAGSRRVVNQLYIGQMIKWLVLLAGFSSIFLIVKPLSAAAVITGFIIMQLASFFSLLHAS